MFDFEIKVIILKILYYNKVPKYLRYIGIYLGNLCTTSLNRKVMMWCGFFRLTIAPFTTLDKTREKNSKSHNVPPGYTDDGGDSTIWPSLWDCDCVGFPIIFPDWIGRPDENWTIDSDVVKWNWSLLRFVFEFDRSARLLHSVRFKSKISPHFKTKYFHSTFNESFWYIIGSSDHIYILDCGK